MTRFDREVNAPGVQFKEAKRYTPAHEYMLRMVIQALGMGLAVYIAAFLICLGIEELHVRWAAVTSGASILLVLGVNYVMQWKQELLWAVEEIFGHDLDGDGKVGKEITHYDLPAGPHTIKMGEIDIAPQLLVDWCDAAWNRRSLAFGVWESRFALQDGTSGRRRYQAFRDEMVRREYAEEVGGNVGIRPRWNNPEAVTFIGGFAQVDVAQGTPLLEQ